MSELDKKVGPISVKWAFLFGCIGSRSLFTLAAYYARNTYLHILGAIAGLISLGWFYIIFIGRRDTGPEVAGGQIWWKHLRPIHMLFWATFAYLALNDCPSAWKVLALDTSFGLAAFLHRWASL
jgi:hypothetical protein